VGDDLQPDRTGLTMESASGKRLAQTTLDHADDRLDLPSLAIAALVAGTLEIPPHLPAIVSGRRLIRPTTDRRRNDRADAQLIAQELMNPFAIVARVGQQRIDLAARGRSQHHFDQVRMIGARTAPGNSRQNQMGGAVADQPHFGKTPIGHRGLGRTALGASPHEIAAGVMRFKATAVDGGQRRAFFEDLGFGGCDNRLIQEAVSGVFFRSRSAAF